jgi:predicted deacylase
MVRIMQKKIESKKFKTAKGKEFEVSYCTVDSGKPGPTLALLAGQHGMEHIGPVVLKDFAKEIENLDFCGKINICPCANPMALEIDYEFYPENEDLNKINEYFYSRFRHTYCIWGMERAKGINWYNMNRLWNREEIHGVAGEITQWLWKSMVKAANVTIDFHCLQDDKPLIFNWDKDSEKIAKFFGIEAIYPHAAADEFNKGNLGYQASNGDRYAFCVEFSTQHAYKDEFGLGREGILNVMKGTGMMDGDVILKRPVYVVRKHHFMKTEATGHIHCKLNEYDPVKKGDLICEITSLQNFETLDRIYSPVDGVVAKRNHAPISKKDVCLFQILEVDVLAEANTNLKKEKVI